MALAKWIVGGVVLIAITNGSAPLMKYQAEVGYYEGDDMKWYHGAMVSYDDCITEATWKYNQLNSESEGRAFSWICLQWSGGNVVGKVR